MKKDERKQLKMEAFDYVQDSFRRYHDHQLHACLYMDGRIDIEALRQAVIASFYELPQLNATYVSGYWRENGHPEAFQIEVRKGGYEKAQIEELFGTTKLNGEQFQVKVTVFRAEEKDTVCIIVNHMLMDGTGVKKYLYLLCELYNKQFTDNPQSVHYAGGRRDIAWVSDIKVKSRPRGRKPIRERMPIEAGEIPAFITQKVPADRLAKIKVYTKERGVTLNDYMMAAYYMAVRKVFGYNVKTIACPVDLRKYQTKACGLCNQTGNAFCTIKDSKKLDFPQILREVHRQMEEEKKKGYCLRQIKRLNAAFRLLPGGVSRRLIDEVISNPKVAITNLGIIDDEKLVFDGVEVEDCFLTGALKTVPNFQVAVSTYKGEATLGINLRVTKAERIRLTYFLQVMYVILMEPIVN